MGAGAIATEVWDPWFDDSYCKKFEKTDYGPAFKRAFANVQQAFKPEKLRTAEQCAEVIIKVSIFISLFFDIYIYNVLKMMN